MSNPPMWVYRSKLVQSVDKDRDKMAGVSAGVVAAADVNSQPTLSGGLQRPASWATIWFIIATLYLIGVYWGMIRLHKAP